MNPDANRGPPSASSSLRQPQEELVDDLPKMTAEIDAYLSEIVARVEAADIRGKVNVRTTEFTATNFTLSKRDRLWAMKASGELTDSVLVTADGCREPVHVDLLLALEKNMVPFFFQSAPSDATVSSVGEFQVDPSIPSDVLQELIYFAYHRRCNMTAENSMVLATVGVRFGINSLVQHALSFLVNHCSPANVIRAFQLASSAIVANKQVVEYFQKYIEDNFEQIWTVNSADILNLSYETFSTVLAWDKLDIKSECFIWLVIQGWTKADLAGRLQYLSELIKKCLRFGRLHEKYICNEILNSEIFLALPAILQSDVISFMDGVLQGDIRKQAIIDGHELLFAKSIVYFRPRQTKHLLISAGGWIEGRTTNSIELFDYQLNMWLSTTLKLPSPVSYFGLEILDGVLCVFGGSNGREIYKAMSMLDLSKPDPTWVGKCSMIERRCYVASAVLEGHLYALGGFNQQRRIRKCERYNQLMDCWFEIAELNYARSDASAAVYDGRIYIAGGINDSNIEQTVEVYYPEANLWRLVKHMASARTSFAITCYGNRIWAIGGNDGSRRLNSCESYDPETDTWREEHPLNVSRSTFRAINFNGDLHVVGGYNSENPIRSVEKYVPSQGWIKIHPLLHERSGLSLVSLPNILSSAFQ